MPRDVDNTVLGADSRMIDGHSVRDRKAATVQTAVCQQVIRAMSLRVEFFAMLRMTGAVRESAPTS
jgi:hypothetical protein